MNDASIVPAAHDGARSRRERSDEFIREYCTNPKQLTTTNRDASHGQHTVQADLGLGGHHEAHGDSWAPSMDNVGEESNLNEGLEELGLGAEPEMEENEYDPAVEQGDDYAFQHPYDDTNLIPEAEEEAPRPMSAALRKKQREHEEHLALLEQVKALCIKMEKALEDDQADLLNGKPGLRKLQMISEIEACASQVKAHPLLLQSGFLGLLKGFLEPLELPRMNAERQPLLALPHLQIRQLVYKLLAALPISTQQQEGRNILKTSEIGRVLRFYSKVKHETEANRRAVGEILNRWMLPIIEEGRKAVRDEQNENMRVRERELDMRRRRQLDKEQDFKQNKRLEEQQQGNRIGDAGYRYHARVPKTQRPDYVHAPTVSAHVRSSTIRHIEKGKVTKEKGLQSKVNAATRKLVVASKVGASASTRLEKATKNVGNDIL